jgi:hypothetical protein
MSDGGWIKFDKDMPDHPLLLESAQELADRVLAGLTRPADSNDTRNAESNALLFSQAVLLLARNALLGSLVRLWSYADTHILDDDTLRLSSKSLDALVGIEGFTSLMPPEWVAKLNDRTVMLPGYCAKNGLISKRKRAADNKARQAAFRARQKAEHDRLRNAAGGNASITHHALVTKCVDQDQDLSKNPSLQERERNDHVTHDVTHTEPTLPERSGGAHAPRRLSEAERHRHCEELRAAYPPGAHRENWIAAEKFASQIVANGWATFEALKAGVERYRAFVEATGSYVMNPAKFYSAEDRPWQQPWKLPTARSASIQNFGGGRVAKTTEELEARERAKNGQH